MGVNTLEVESRVAGLSTYSTGVVLEFHVSAHDPSHILVVLRAGLPPSRPKIGCAE
jgi:hypothetical protein